jgi:hypothetical protein
MSRCFAKSIWWEYTKEKWQISVPMWKW